MNLVLVEGRVFAFQCSGCGETYNSFRTRSGEPYPGNGYRSRKSLAYANTDGEAFKEYYCEGCFPKFEKGK